MLWKRRHRIYNLCYMTSVCGTNQVSPSRHVPVPQVDWHLSQPLSGGRETNIGQQPIWRLVAHLSLRHYVCPCTHPHRLYLPELYSNSAHFCIYALWRCYTALYRIIFYWCLPNIYDKFIGIIYHKVFIVRVARYRCLTILATFLILYRWKRHLYYFHYRTSK